MSTREGHARLDAFLAHAGFGTRRGVKALIRAGRVTLGGERCRKAGEWVEGREVRVDGERVEPPPSVVHAVLHKPIGLACSHDPREAPLIYDLLPDAWLGLGLEAAGRLDRDTSGLIVLSTDGGWIHRLTHPVRKIEKRYRIEYEGELVADAALRCSEGIELDADAAPTRPARLLCEGPGRATLHLAEGRHHQVRRMIAALGGVVVALHRDRIGAYDLPDDLEPGALRVLDDADLLRLTTESSL